MCQHGSIGESYMTTCALSEECKKFMESAKVCQCLERYCSLPILSQATYKYSSELLVTAQNQRSALKIDLRPNLAVQDSLNMTWEALSDALQEEEGRLLLSEQFYHTLEEALNTLYRWVQPVQDLPHSLAAVEGLLKEIIDDRDSLSEQIDECIGEHNLILILYISLSLSCFLSLQVLVNLSVTSCCDHLLLTQTELRVSSTKHLV